MSENNCKMRKSFMSFILRGISVLFGIYSIYSCWSPAPYSDLIREENENQNYYGTLIFLGISVLLGICLRTTVKHVRIEVLIIMWSRNFQNVSISFIFLSQFLLFFSLLDTSSITISENFVRMEHINLVIEWEWSILYAVLENR